MIRAFAFVAAALSLAAPLAAKTLSVAAGEGAQQRLQEALILAQPGDIVELGAGRFALTDGLSLDVDGVTVKGQGMDRSILDFSGQLGAGEGLLVTSDDVVLRDFGVENSKGDGIKSKGADRIVYHRLRVEWTRGPNPENGAYAVYPVESRDILVDSVIAIGASDAGIYVGQAENIIVRNSIVKHNVAGIEIENSQGADVYGNIAVNNTGGILVFDLPDVPKQGGRDARVFDNVIVDNNTANFAPPGNIVANVPAGLGVMVMSNRNVEVFGNRFAENATGNVLVVAYSQPTSKPEYNPKAINVRIFGNDHGRAGYKPGFPGGELLAAAFGGAIPGIIQDGTAENLVVHDAVPTLSLGYTQVGQGPADARPTPGMGDGASAQSQLPAIVLPEAMEAAVR
jgi:parallel beta-helix repeat protein